MSKDLSAVCPECDNIIEVDENVQIGDMVGCTNEPCMFEGTVESIDEGGNVWFEEGPIGLEGIG